MRSASYPFAALRWGCPWRGPLASVSGCVRCGVLAWVDPVTDASGFPSRLSFHGGLGRCSGAVSCGRRHLPFRIGGRHARVPRVCPRACFLGWNGRAGLQGAFWCASPFSVALLGALFVCSAPFGLRSSGLWFFPLSSPSAPPLSPAFRVFRPWVPWALASCAPPPSLVFFVPSSVPPLSPAFLLFRPWVPWALASCAPPLFFFSCAVVCRLCGAAVVCPGLWGVLVCVAVGLALRRGPVCACAPPFGAPCLCLLLWCCYLLCCACPVGPCWRRSSRWCCSWCLLVVPPPPPPLVVVSSVVLRRASCRVALRSVVRCVFCPVLCGVLVSGWVLALCCLARCCAGPCCAPFVLLCHPTLSSAFAAGSGLWAGSELFVFLCSACAVLRWCACVVALCAVLSSPCGAGWSFVLFPLVFACLLLALAVLCCLLVGPGGSWCHVSVVCCAVSLGAVLRRVAACCAAWRCVVVRRGVSFWSVWCCRTLCCVLGRCPSSWGPLPSGAVFCLVSPRCVCFAVVCCCVVLFADVLCAVCALGCRAVCSLSSPPCAVLLCGPLSLGALLLCAVPRGAVLPHGAVVSCPAALLCLFLAFVWFHLLEDTLQHLFKCFFGF